MDPITSALIIVLCLVLSAAFSGSETALLKLDPADLDEELSERGGPSLAAVRELVRSSSRFLVTILLGNNVVNILAASVASALAVDYLGRDLGLIVSTVVLTLVVLIFAEIIPKAVAARSPHKVAEIAGMPLYLLQIILTPVYWLFTKLVEPLVHRLAGEERESLSTSEKMFRLARRLETTSHGATSPESLVASAARLSDTQAADVMVPKSKIFSLPLSTPSAIALDEVLANRFTRVPVHRGDIDKLIGIVHLRDLVELNNRGGGDLLSIVKPVIRVPARTNLMELLKTMQTRSIHLCIVKDEFNNTLGLITLEDILEELVGEIRDEFDAEELSVLSRVTDDCWEADADTLVLDFNRRSGWALEAYKGERIGGLIYNGLGKTPTAGDVLEVGAYRLEAIAFEAGRLVRVRITRASESEAKIDSETVKENESSKENGDDVKN